MNPLVLVILDGFGHRDRKEANAVALARMPHWRAFLKNYPPTLLETSGEAVGLPPGVMGNSEVGHLTIGSGRVLYQDLLRINHAIEDASFFKNPVLQNAFAKAKGRTVHLMGLLSDGGVHSHINHLFALFKMAKQWLTRPSPTPRPRLGHPLPQGGEGKIVVHAFLDGRDTPPKSSREYLRRLQKEMKEAGIGEIGTLIGRYYAMDRDKRWERVRIAYEALVDGKGERHTDPVQAVGEIYQKHVTDEFVQPMIFGEKNRIEDGEGVVFFNFRADRARELTRALTDPKFDGFPRVTLPRLGTFVCFTQYDKTFDLPVAFPPERPKQVLAEIFSQRGLRQFHTAETEKYAHVTYFFNGGVEEPFPLEERLLVPSPKDIPTYDKRPEMSARQVTEAALQKLGEGYPIVIMNYANPDMVGHSGDLQATIKALEVVDDCLGQLAKAVVGKKGAMILTADHGNCEEMRDETGGPHTAHTTNPVPFVLIGERWRHVRLRSGGSLQDVAPTILKILEIPQPAEMTGESLIIEA